MATIIKLSPHEARKIAAGEVIERPANIVKELIENSIDAGATHITLSVGDGGKELVRVVDNGCGMSEEDAHLCFEHHATSKIKTVADLETITTFGFRGEALSSIAAVSTATLITKRAEAQTGIQLTLAQGTLTQQTQVSTNTGTDITIADILHNLPARKKFLKTRETEFNHIQRTFQAFCLCYPAIHFKLFSENNLVTNCPTTDSLITRIGQVWNMQGAPYLVSLIEKEERALTIRGVISNHQHARYDRNNILFFVNNRLVKNQPLTRALLKGYANVLPPGRFPAACIFITVDPATIDVNIHPRKEEVQFLHPRIIEVALEAAVKQTLENYLSQQVQRTRSATHDRGAQQTPQKSDTSWHTNILPAHVGILHGHEYPALFSPSPFEEQGSGTPYKQQPEPIGTTYNAAYTNVQTLDVPTNTGTSASTDGHAGNLSKQNSWPNRDNAASVPDQDSTQQAYAFADAANVAIEKNYTLIGQLHKTYLLLEKPDGLYVVDQHAAHERILYERFRMRFDDAATVTLMFPQLITLTADALPMISPHLPIYHTMGVMLDIFNDHQLSLTATPVYLKNVNFQEVVETMLGLIAEYQHLEHAEISKALTEKLHAQMACKAAVKAGDELSHEQMITLLDDLQKTANNFTCPHGRPTGWLLSSYEIEKKFKRKI